MVLLGKWFSLIPVWVWELLFVICLCAGGLLNGKIQYYRGEHAELEKIKTAQQEYAKQSQVITQQVKTVYVDRIKTVTQAGRTIIKKVPIYVTKKDDLACRINNGFVSLWNYSNQMSVPKSSSSVDDSPSSTILSDVAAEHEREAEYTNKLFIQLTQLQDWVRQQQQLSEHPIQ